MIYATPNRNGNTKRHFYDAAIKVLAAELALREALREADANILHGRNYQTVPDEQFCRAHDRAEMVKAFKNLDEVHTFGMDLSRAGMAK